MFSTAQNPGQTARVTCPDDWRQLSQVAVSPALAMGALEPRNARVDRLISETVGRFRPRREEPERGGSPLASATLSAGERRFARPRCRIESPVVTHQKER